MMEVTFSFGRWRKSSTHVKSATGNRRLLRINSANCPGIDTHCWVKCTEKFSHSLSNACSWTYFRVHQKHCKHKLSSCSATTRTTTCTSCKHLFVICNGSFSPLRVLILHLKRYSFNAQLSLNSKLGQQVVIPRHLTLLSHCTESTRPPISLNCSSQASM